MFAFAKNMPQQAETCCRHTRPCFFTVMLYVQGAKILNTDWSDVVLRKDMQMYLCSVAEGTNPSTGEALSRVP
jgi:hypothetical protein